MDSDFLAAVDAAVAQALPSDWPRLPQHRLPACGDARARHAFRRSQPGEAAGAAATAGGRGAAAYLAIVAVPPAAVAPAAPNIELAALVDLILARGAGLLLLYEAGAAHADWILDHLAFPHPRLLALACVPAASPARDTFEVEPTWCGPEPLSKTIHDLWTGNLFYDGPLEGPQTVGVEILRDACWRCSSSIATVSGIVLPDREVAEWSSPDWSYFQQIAELAALPDSMIARLAAAVESWRANGDNRLTPIRWRYGKTVANSSWAAACPFCGALRGAVPVLAERLPKLASLDSRRAGALRYRPLEVDVPRQLLHDLIWICEITPHARPLGWRRAGAPTLGVAQGAAISGALPNSAALSGAVPSNAALSPALPTDTVLRGALPVRPAISASGSPSPAGGAVVLLPSVATQSPPAPSPHPLDILPPPAPSPLPWRRLGQTLAAWLHPRRSL